MKIIMDEITLCSMTRELCHRFFREFENDPAVFCDEDDYAFEVLGMEAVNADTLLKNERSRRVLEKAGFQCVGRDECFWYYRKRKKG